MTTRTRFGVIALGFLLGLGVGYYLLGGGTGGDPRLAPTVADPQPLIFPGATGSTEIVIDGLAAIEPVVPRIAPEFVEVAPVEEPVVEVPGGERTVPPALITLPDGSTADLGEMLLDSLEPPEIFRFIDPCAGTAPGEASAEPCEGVSGTILGYTTPGPFRITRVTTASLPGIDPAYDLCRLQYGTLDPDEINLAIYSTLPGDFTIEGEAEFTSLPEPENATPGATSTAEGAWPIGPIIATTSNAQTAAWQAEMGSPRPNPGVVTCIQITPGPEGVPLRNRAASLFVRIRGTSLLGSTAFAQLSLVNPPFLEVPPTTLFAGPDLSVMALIPVRADHTASLAVIPVSGSTPFPPDQSRVNEVCAAGATGNIRIYEMGRTSVDAVVPGGIFRWDPAWTEFVVLEARLPVAGAYIACASRHIDGLLTEWTGFTIITPAYPVIHVDIESVTGGADVNRADMRLLVTRAFSEYYEQPWLTDHQHDVILSRRARCEITDLSVRRDACTLQGWSDGSSTLTVGVGHGLSGTLSSVSLPGAWCWSTPWSCPERTDHYWFQVFEPTRGSSRWIGSVNIAVRQVMPVFPEGWRAASDPTRWAIQTTGARLSTNVDAVLPPGPPELASVSLGPAPGDGPGLTLTMTATRPVAALVTVEGLVSPGCRTPATGGRYGPFGFAMSVTVNLPVACAGARYSLRLDITDAEGRSSVYSDLEPGAVGSAVVGVSSTRTNQARVRATLGAGTGGRPLHLASASITIDGRVVWSLPSNDGLSTRRCTAGTDLFGMPAATQFQSSETTRVRVEVEFVPYTNCATGAGRGTPQRHVLDWDMPATVTLPIGVANSDPIPRLEILVERN